MIRKSVINSEAKLENTKSCIQEQAIACVQTIQVAPIETEVSKQFASQESSILQLPWDFPKMPDTAYCAGYHSFMQSDRRAESVQSQSQTLHQRSLVLAAFNTLFYRYTQQETITVSLNLVGNDRDVYPITEIRSQLNGELTGQSLVCHTSELLDNVSQKSSSSLANLSTPGVVELRSPLPVSITLVEPGAALETQSQWLNWLQDRDHKLLHQQDLQLVVACQQQPLSGIWIYNANLFKPGTIQRLAGHFETILTAFVASVDSNVDIAISQLSLLTAAEQHQLLVEWNSPSVAYSQIPVFRHIEAHAVQYPEAIAVTFHDQHLTYQELDHRANQLAHYLVETGVTAGDRVAVCIQPALEIGIVLLGIFKAGGVYVPLDPTHPTDRLAAILEDTQAKVVLTQTQLLPVLPAIAAPILCVDQQETWSMFPMSSLDVAIDLDQTAYIIYTSGTTGKPKGVMASHRNLVNYIFATQDRLGFDRQDVMPSIARYTFSIALFELLSPLAAGGTLVLLEREHVLDFARLTQTLERLTMLHTVPSLMQKLVTYIKENQIDPQTFQGMKHVFTGGDTVPADLLEALKEVFPNAKVAVLYGCSEVSSLCATFPVPRDRTISRSRIGKPFNNVTIRLYDPAQNLVPIGVPGEIYVSGAGVTQGYLNRDDLTQEKFILMDGQRFYKTGDLGRLDADGNVEFLGRADFQIKLRGIRIELGDIESTLRRAPGVREGVVMAQELGREKSLIAYVVLDPTKNPAIADIRLFLQAQLPDYMVPAGFVVLDAMPLNPNQKVDRRALPLPTPENLAGARPFLAPRNDVEHQLVELWEAAIGTQPIGIQDNFFELGGNSLLAVSLITQIEQSLGKKLPVSAFVTTPTIAELATSLTETPSAPAQNSLVLLRDGTTKLPIFFIHDGDGETLLYRNLALCLKPGHPVYGIQPYSRPGHPILHTSFTEMATYYLEQIRAIQPEGPYFLSGLCIGGILAFEIALQLQLQNQTVGMVGLLDAADVAAAKRSRVIANKRFSNFSKSLGKQQHLNRQHHLFEKMLASGKKVRNLVAYEVGSKVRRYTNTIKIRMFKSYLDQEMMMPKFLQNISPRTIFQFAEKNYSPQGLYQGEVLLLRATQASNTFDNTPIDDTPYAEFFTDPLLGWENRVTQGVKAYDLAGGHSSMLQPPNVQVMAEKMQAWIDAAIATPSHQSEPCLAGNIIDNEGETVEEQVEHPIFPDSSTQLGMRVK